MIKKLEFNDINIEIIKSKKKIFFKIFSKKKLEFLVKNIVFTLTPLFSNSGKSFAARPNSVVQTGVKSAGWLKRTAQLLFIAEWNSMGPEEVSALKSGTTSPRNRLTLGLYSAILLFFLLKNFFFFNKIFFYLKLIKSNKIKQYS